VGLTSIRAYDSVMHTAPDVLPCSNLARFSCDFMMLHKRVAIYVNNCKYLYSCMTTEVSTASETVVMEGIVKCYAKGLEACFPAHLIRGYKERRKLP